MDPLIQKVIIASKRVAESHGRSFLELDSVILGLVLLREDQAIRSAVAECLGAKVVVWPDTLVTRLTETEKISAEAVRDRKFELGPVFKKIYNHLPREAPFASFLNGILLSPEARNVEEVQKLHASQSAVKPVLSLESKGLLAKLSIASEIGDRIEASLAREIVGQPDAIRMLARGYLRAIREPASAGLRGIFTFMGPPGVGKTMLAERFAEALTSVEGQKYGTFKVSMEMSDRESLILTLFGLDNSYGKAKTGLLHDKVKENPRLVIVFDEIEKAPPPIIQSLLTMLNDGSFHDRCKNDFVDLSKCFVIFTTNLGQDVFASRNRSGILRGRSFHSDELFDLLAAAKRREESMEENAPAALAPEFVSRLRKGGAVLFNQLSGTDYLDLLEKAFGRIPTSESALPRVRIDDECKKLLLLSLLPDISPRRVDAEAGMLVTRWTEDLVEAPPESMIRDNPESCNVAMKLELDNRSKTVLAEIHSNQKLQVLVVDNDKRMTKFLDNYVGENFSGTTLSIDRVEEAAQATGKIQRSAPDLLLLDLDLPDSDLPEGGILALHRQIVETAPELPVFFFSESSEWKEKLQAIVAQGGARGFFSFTEETDNLLIGEDQQARFRRLLENTLFEKTMAGFVRSRRKLELSHRFEFDPATNTVWICLSRLRLAQVVSLADETGGILPAGIPSVTFDDVFGLDRAKDRLRDAVSFLKNPRLLNAFGTHPPSGFLLAGPSGTGKTHLARAVANAAGCVFYSLSAGELDAKYSGEGEKRLRNLFQAARKYAPAVIFIDEIDAIAGNRSSGLNGHSNHVKMLNQLLVCMDGFADTKGTVLVLAATNRPEALDPAVLRPGRFDETIRIEAPDAKAREQMFRKRLQGLPRENSIDAALPTLICRTAAMSPAELDRILREAIYLAAREERQKLSLSDLETACNLVRYGANRKDMIIKEEDRRRTAWHEAGHAVARLILFPESKLDYLSIVPNESGALGFAAWQHDESKHTHSAEDYRHLIMVALAGREAEKLCPRAGTDAINTGASSDYETATALAWDAVTRFGFDETVGPMSLQGIPAHLHAELVPSLRAGADSFLRECLHNTKELMQENQQNLSKLAESLLKKQALSGFDVDLIIKNPFD